MRAADKLQQARDCAQAGAFSRAVRLGWDAANGAMTEHDERTMADVELFARDLARHDSGATQLADYCQAVLAQGPQAVRAPSIFDKYLRREPRRRPCPRCGESIAREARVCRFCGVEIG